MSVSLLVLAIPASLALLLLIIHSHKMRGGVITFFFFGSLFLFGLLRGNLVYLITRGKTPYSFELPVMKVGHTGLVEAVGWCVSLYISWSLAERLLARRRGHGKNLFSILFFSCAMMMGFAILMEAAAGRMGWWNWRPPRGLSYSPAFRDIEKGIVEWFSVAFDFLTPWLLIAYGGFRKRWWAFLGLLPFPFHFGMHAIRRFRLDEHLIKVNHLSHFVMLALAVTMPYFLYREMKSVPDYTRPPDGKARLVQSFDLIGLAIVVLTVCAGLTIIPKQWELSIFALPLVVTAAYAFWWSNWGCLKCTED